jgi:thiol peroxidase
MANDMTEVKGADQAGQPRILLSVPSLDTPVCDLEVRRFNMEVGKLPAVRVFTMSMDLPFAQKRWCGGAGVERVQTLSDYKERSFGPAYGVFVPTMGLHTRAVFVIDLDNKIRHVEYVRDATQEPDYHAAIEAARAMV